MIRKYLPWAASLFILLFFLVAILTTRTDNNVIQEKDCVVKPPYNLSLALKNISAAGLTDSFPYKAYLDSANICDIISVKKDLNTLDSLYKDLNISRRTLSNTLTLELYKRSEDKLKKYDPDYLLSMLQWSEKFKAYAQVEPENYDLFISVYDYWFTQISDKLVDYSKIDNSCKYEFKYKYLVARCNEKKHSVGLEVTKTEKFLQNLIDNKWDHLMNASWTQSSKLQKILFFAIIIFTLYAYYLLFKKIINRNEKK
jgi:hypothetical protein